MSVNQLESVSVTAPDGRALEVALGGPAGGVPLFFHHGTPGAAAVFAPLVEQGAERNLRHIAYSRPGYGRSDRLPGRSVASCAADVAAIADALGYERFHSIGGSGGGPHSLACAALLEDRVISAGVIASVAPFDAEGLDWTADMGQENIDEFAAIQGGEEELRTYLEGMAAAMAGPTAEQIVAALGDTVSEVDRRALTGAYGDYLAREVEHALSGGVWGWVDDDIAFASDWGFDPASIRVPFSIWHGAHDRFVPIAHGQWLADHMTASTHLRPDQGHLSLALAAYGEVLDDLLKD
jgi:pimeloyl-ACP methyl ester carboxylesterase